MHSYAAPEGQVLRKLRIPNALPYIFTALRVTTTTLSVIGAVVGSTSAGPQHALGIYITSKRPVPASERVGGDRARLRAGDRVLSLVVVLERSSRRGDRADRASRGTPPHRGARA